MCVIDGLLVFWIQFNTWWFSYLWVKGAVQEHVALALILILTERKDSVNIDALEIHLCRIT